MYTTDTPNPIVPQTNTYHSSNQNQSFINQNPQQNLSTFTPQIQVFKIWEFFKILLNLFFCPKNLVQDQNYLYQQNSQNQNRNNSHYYYEPNQNNKQYYSNASSNYQINSSYTNIPHSNQRSYSYNDNYGNSANNIPINNSSNNFINNSFNNSQPLNMNLRVNNPINNPQIYNNSFNNTYHTNTNLTNQLQNNTQNPYTSEYRNFKETTPIPAYRNSYSNQPKSIVPNSLIDSEKRLYNNHISAKPMNSYSNHRKQTKTSSPESRSNSSPIHRNRRQKSKKTRKNRKNSNSSNSSVEITYVSYAKHKGNSFKARRHSLSSDNNESIISDSYSNKSQHKKIGLYFTCDSKPVVSKDEKSVALNKDLERQIISYKVIGNEKPLISQEKNLFDKMKLFLPSELKKKNNEFAIQKENSEEIKESSEILENNMIFDKNIQHNKKNNNKLLEEKSLEENKIESDIKLKIQDIDAKDSEEKIESPLEKDEFNFENRYFIKNPTKICFRCHKVGHYEKTCTEELIWKIQCMNCLGEHRSIFCDSIVCFKCRKIGHINKDCPVRLYKSCVNCNKTGHNQQNCGMVEMDKGNFPNKYQISEDDRNKLQCFVCMKKDGDHLNCKKILIGNKRKVDDLYDSEISFQKNNYSLYWKGTKKIADEKSKRYNYQNIDKNAIDSMEELENF